MKRFWSVAILIVSLTSCKKDMEISTAQAEEVARNSLAIFNLKNVKCDTDAETCALGFGSPESRSCGGVTESGVQYTATCDAYHCWSIEVNSR